MTGALQDLYETRTARDRDGTVGDEWNRVLLRRDLDRLIAECQVEPVDWLFPPESDSRERKFFHDLGTGEIYVYVAAAERSGPQFRRLREGDTSSLRAGTQSIQ
jgi:hypothetical protein